MKVLFLGAGASFGARAHFSCRPPLGKELCEWLRGLESKFKDFYELVDLSSTYSRAFEILNQYRAITDFEKLMPKLGREERKLLHKLLQIAFSSLSARKISFAHAFNDSTDLYDDLIKRLNLNGNDWVVVTLNYDILFEEALYRAGIPFYYPKVPFQYGDNQSTGVGIKVYKPHGSVNFFGQADIKIFHHEPGPNDDRGIPTSFEFDAENAIPNYPIVFAGLRGAENVLGRAADGSIPQVFMANYEEGKAVEVNINILREIRRLALAEFAQADFTTVIGVRPVSEVDDQFVAKAFGSIQKGEYVSPSEEDLKVAGYCNCSLDCKRMTLFEYLK